MIMARIRGGTGLMLPPEGVGASFGFAGTMGSSLGLSQRTSATLVVNCSPAALSLT